MKPLLLLTTRPEHAIVEDEVAAFRRGLGVAQSDLVWLRMEQNPLPPIELSSFSGVLLGGGPFNASDPSAKKSAAQQRVERELAELVPRIVDTNTPLLGACYGIGVLTSIFGGVVDQRFGEVPSAVPISWTEAGRRDPLAIGMPATFEAVVGHKEACSVLPAGAVLLASAPACPVQLFRFGERAYATQFHPELDAADTAKRMAAYGDRGYFRPEEYDSLVAQIASANLDWPPTILRNFAVIAGFDRNDQSRRSAANSPYDTSLRHDVASAITTNRTA